MTRQAYVDTRRRIDMEAWSLAEGAYYVAVHEYPNFDVYSDMSNVLLTQDDWNGWDRRMLWNSFMSIYLFINSLSGKEKEDIHGMAICPDNDLIKSFRAAAISLEVGGD